MLSATAVDPHPQYDNEVKLTASAASECWLTGLPDDCPRKETTGNNPFFLSAHAGYGCRQRVRLHLHGHKLGQSMH